jgi:hypothetical protein
MFSIGVTNSTAAAFVISVYISLLFFHPERCCLVFARSHQEQQQQQQHDLQTRNPVTPVNEIQLVDVKCETVRIAWL